MVAKSISHYQIFEKLGEGGMGVVYKARDTHLDRSVALKFLHSSEDVPRLLREAKTAASLNHTNICGVYEVAPEHGFIAMELVEGQSLAVRIAGRPLPVEEAVGLAVQICEGLKAAHDKGITHRDIKSGNVLVAADGHAKILDFGLARVAGQAGLTREGAAAGTPGYMAPEQMRGEPVDRRTDVWAVGAVLHEMLTGRLPLGQIETLPEGLGRVVRKALATDPRERYQHIEDLLVDLRAWAKPSAAVRAVSRRWLTAALVLLGAVGITLGIMVALRTRSPDSTGPYTAVPLTSFPGREVNPSISPDGNQVAFAWNGEKQENYDIYVMLIGTGSVLQLTTDPALEFSPAWSPDGRYIAFLRRLAAGNFGLFVVPALGGTPRQVGESGVSIGGREIPQAALASQIAWTADSQSLVVDDYTTPGELPFAMFLISTSTRERRRLTSPPVGLIGDLSPSVSASGRRLAFIRLQSPVEGHVYYLDLTEDLRPSGEPVRLTTGAFYPDSPAWGADEETLFYSSAPFEGLRNLWKIRISGDRRPVRLPSVGEDSYAVAVSRLRRRMIYSRHVEDANIYRLPLNADGLPAGSPIRMTFSNRDDSRPQYSPDGRRICFASNRSGTRELWITNSDGSGLMQLTNLGGSVMTAARWSPDGQRLLFALEGEKGQDAYVMRSDGSQPQRLTGTVGAELIPSWSRDGKWIYFPSRQSGERRIWRTPTDGGEPVQLTQKSGEAPLESTDGKWLYYWDGSDQWIWKIAVSGGVETRVAGPVNHRTNFAVNDRGIYFVAPARLGEGAAIRFFDFASAKVRRVLTLSNSPRPGLDISPDGKWLLYSQFDHAESDLMLVENFP